MFRVQLPLPSRRELERQFTVHAPVHERILHELQRRIQSALAPLDVTPTVKWRLKRFESLYEKLLRRAREVRDQENGSSDPEAITITDLLGIRVVCPFIEEIGLVEARVRSSFDIVEVERKGSQLAHTEFGYSSVHLLIQTPTDILESFHLGHNLFCEVQLRTILQDAWAEVEHELVYKAELTPLDGQLRRKLAALNANLTLSDIIFQEIRDYQRNLHSQLMKRREQFWTQLELNGKVNGQDHEPESEVIHTGSDTIDNLLLNALHAHNEKDYETAVRIYSDILAYQPADHIAAVIHAHRGMARFALGAQQEAIEDFTRTIQLSPQTTKAYYYRGVVYRSLGRLEEGLSDLSRCLEFDPYHLESRLARARLYRDMHDWDAARADCEMALRLEPDNSIVQQLYQELKEELKSP